jgi:hypothetical protein
MDVPKYRDLRQQLMKTFQQLVIFDLKESNSVEIQVIKDQSQATIYDLTTTSTTETSKLYYVGSYNYKPLIVILEKPTGDPYQIYVTTIYNLYGALIKHNTHMVSFEDMERLAEQLSDQDKTIHWIWFRDNDTYLPDKIMSRAKSWIALNPTFKFYLWTNLIDLNELDDFISNLHESNREYFTNGQIIVKFQEETMACVGEFCQKYGQQLNDPDATMVLTHLYDIKHPTTQAVTNTVSTTTKTVVTTTIITETQNNFKINRIFKVDLLRIMVLDLYGGIYSDFNDTICFYPMKYLLTMYPNTYFVGTDYDIDHPIYRNNYFLYSSLHNEEFHARCMTCVNKGVNEYLRVTSIEYMNTYYRVCLEFLLLVNQLTTVSINTRDEPYLVPLFIQLDSIKQIIAEDKLKDLPRVITLIAELLGYFGQEMINLKYLSQRLVQELDMLDANCLKIYKIKPKMRRGCRRRTPDQVVLPVIYDREKMDKMVITYECHDYFLIKYAIVMTIGDLILSTNIAYIDEVKNLIPYSRSNRLSTISMLTHIYDGTSYGLTKNYDTIDHFANDLRKEFL